MNDQDLRELALLRRVVADLAGGAGSQAVTLVSNSERTECDDRSDAAAAGNSMVERNVERSTRPQDLRAMVAEAWLRCGGDERRLAALVSTNSDTANDTAIAGSDSHGDFDSPSTISRAAQISVDQSAKRRRTGHALQDRDQPVCPWDDVPDDLFRIIGFSWVASDRDVKSLLNFGATCRRMRVLLLNAGQALSAYYPARDMRQWREALELSWCDLMLSHFPFLEGSVPRGHPDLLWLPMNADEEEWLAARSVQSSTEVQSDDATNESNPSIGILALPRSSALQALSPYDFGLLVNDCDAAIHGNESAASPASGSAAFGLSAVVPLRYRWPIPHQFPLHSLLSGQPSTQSDLMKRAAEYTPFCQTVIFELWRAHGIEQAARRCQACIWRARYETFARGLVRYRCALRSAPVGSDDAPSVIGSATNDEITDVLVRCDGTTEDARFSRHYLASVHARCPRCQDASELHALDFFIKRAEVEKTDTSSSFYAAALQSGNPQLASSLVGDSQFRVGQTVLSRWSRGQQEYRAHVFFVHSNGALDISYDDGDFDLRLDPARVRPWSHGTEQLASFTYLPEAELASLRQLQARSVEQSRVLSLRQHEVTALRSPRMQVFTAQVWPAGVHEIIAPARRLVSAAHLLGSLRLAAVQHWHACNPRDIPAHGQFILRER